MSSLSPSILTCDDLFAVYNSRISSPRLQEFEHEDFHNSNNGININNENSKKSIHNEYERDRRKKLNKLYSSLRELLPEKDQRKKLSIPCTIARVLKYIPELQKHIEKLQSAKEELLLRVSSNEFTSTCSENVIQPMISAIFLGRREILIQIYILRKSLMVPLSMIMKVLEREGLQIMNAMTHTSYDGKTIYLLYLQSTEDIIIEDQIFCEQLIKSLSEQTV
ncbi:transcription factor bHLH101-like [Asparagus officinalis]|uniref:transcription factor bHLH101-like n=1 Tax=Asparagus officinalis TaxID=4686 RepID=UPI00098E3146|nr:transcription factor bHLH101-like [Asparagus officinalis]